MYTIYKFIKYLSKYIVFVKLNLLLLRATYRSEQGQPGVKTLLVHSYNLLV
jgi:hypothetical protein